MALIRINGELWDYGVWEESKSLVREMMRKYDSMESVV